MAHREWCGKLCSECSNPCELDMSIPCAPDCECLGENGETDCFECKTCDAINDLDAGQNEGGMI